MNRELRLFILAVAIMLGSAAPGNAAAGSQPFFQGSWRCQHGQTMNVTPAFGPWLSYRVTSGSTTTQSYVYHDNAGGWVNTGVDSSGGYWTTTSYGWQGSQLTFTGNYTNFGKTESQKQVFTRNAGNAMTVQIWRNGALIGQSGCNK